jgi:hypothetical protein
LSTLVSAFSHQPFPLAQSLLSNLSVIAIRSTSSTLPSRLVSAPLHQIVRFVSLVVVVREAEVVVEDSATGSNVVAVAGTEVVVEDSCSCFMQMQLSLALVMDVSLTQTKPVSQEPVSQLKDAAAEERMSAHGMVFLSLAFTIAAVLFTPSYVLFNDIVMIVVLVELVVVAVVVPLQSVLR